MGGRLFLCNMPVAGKWASGLYFVQTVSPDSNFNRLLMVKERAEVSREIKENV